jgi:hypothetical protein
MESPRQGLPMMVGNSLSGEETDSQDFKLISAYSTSSIQSNKPSMEEKASSQEFTCKNTLILLLSDEHYENIDEAILVEKLIGLLQRANDWDLKIDSEYSAKEARVIYGLHNILLNVSNGFGDRNNQASYEEKISNDPSGLLTKEAIVGMKWTKKMILAGHLFPFHYPYVTGKKKLKKNKRRNIKWPSILDCDLESDDMERLLQIDLASLSKASAGKIAVKKKR